jgi:hypothetical protein
MSSARDDPKIPADAAAGRRRLTRHLGRPLSQPERAAANDLRRAGDGPSNVPPNLGGQHGSAALTLEAVRAAGEHLRAAGGQLEALAVTVDPCLTNLAALHLRQRIALAHHVLDPGPD